MGQLMRYLVCTVICLSVLSVLTKSASLPYGFDLDDLSPDEIEEAMQIIDNAPVKRAMCRDGFTYQAILRDCVPSLGALRGRGRNGRRRGRRGLPQWSWRF